MRPPDFGGIGPPRRHRIVSRHDVPGVALFVFATRADGGTGFGADDRHLREFGVEVVDLVVAVIETDDIEHGGDAIAIAAVHGRRDQAGGVELIAQPLHGFGDGRAAVGALLRLLIADRPQDDARVVAIAQDHGAQLVETFVGRGHHPRLVEHQHTHAVAGVEQFRRRRVVRGADGVAAHVLQALQAIGPDGVRNRAAHAAWSWWLQVPLILTGWPLRKKPVSGSNLTSRKPKAVVVFVAAAKRVFEAA